MAMPRIADSDASLIMSRLPPCLRTVSDSIIVHYLDPRFAFKGRPRAAAPENTEDLGLLRFVGRDEIGVSQCDLGLGLDHTACL
jgi:hypothetical protein